jgi:hypothetical protein
LYLPAIKTGIQHLEEKHFYDVALMYLEQIGYRDLSVVDGAGDGGRDITCSRDDLRSGTLGAVVVRLGRKVVRPKFDRLSMRRAVGRYVPFIVATREHCGCGQALRKDDLLKRCEPMMVARRRSGGLGTRFPRSLWRRGVN